MFKLIPCVTPCGRHVDTIDKKHCSLSFVPDDVLRYGKTLEECRLDANNIRDLPKQLFNKLERIRVLSLSDNNLVDIPLNIGNCKSLVELDLSRNRNYFHYFDKLIVLEIKDLPNSIGLLTQLQSFDPPLLGQLKSLTELWIDENELRALPSEIGMLSNLQELDLSENFISSLPDSISGLQSLTDLNLTRNSLDSLPDGIGALKKINILKLAKNQISYLNPILPDSIGQLNQLSNLNVDQNQLTELTPSIGKCSQLRILQLRANRLRSLPPQIGDLSELQILDVALNK
ncbi:hypothetical protein Ciccas_009890 [Cichlidogyrus casuarinus]|uniref:Disease resistance R13L4/SHOC-2-like LRR domain-containing protein n=1 Tax=Cichlidogyrus casuarinus TaxID=1844966 RepID=A0ABD2PWG4_9PLAT